MACKKKDDFEKGRVVGWSKTIHPPLHNTIKKKSPGIFSLAYRKHMKYNYRND
jgi:hypothetical protein